MRRKSGFKRVADHTSDLLYLGGLSRIEACHRDREERVSFARDVVTKNAHSREERTQPIVVAHGVLSQLRELRLERAVLGCQGLHALRNVGAERGKQTVFLHARVRAQHSLNFSDNLAHLSSPKGGVANFVDERQNVLVLAAQLIDDCDLTAATRLTHAGLTVRAVETECGAAHEALEGESFRERVVGVQ